MSLKSVFIEGKRSRGAWRTDSSISTSCTTISGAKVTRFDLSGLCLPAWSFSLTSIANGLINSKGIGNDSEEGGVGVNGGVGGLEGVGSEDWKLSNRLFIKVAGSSNARTVSSSRLMFDAVEMSSQVHSEFFFVARITQPGPKGIKNKRRNKVKEKL